MSETERRRHKTIAMHLAVVALVGLLAYSNTFDVPFHLDDKPNITENPLIRDVSFFLNPSAIDRAMLPKPLDTLFERRVVGYLSFLLNYKLHGLDVRGYHALNLAIHVLNGFMVYMLVCLTLGLPRLEGSALRRSRFAVAFTCSMLFVAHPVQTQAVTYIVQRFASLAALFFMGALAAYIASRTSGRSAARYPLYALSILLAALAMKTKENAFTLPAVVALYEFLFLDGRFGRKALGIVPYFLLAAVLLSGFAGAPLQEMLAGADEALVSGKLMTRWEYLATQFRVVATYLRLMLLPVNQNLDYDYPVYGSFLAPQVALSFLLHLLVLGAGILLVILSRRRDFALRFVGFGIFWFYATLSVESSIIPIRDVIFEHRLYLPSAGFIMALSGAVFLLAQRLGRERLRTAVKAVLLAAALLLAAASHARNGVWQSEVSLWSDVVEKSPYKYKPYFMLANAYYREQALEEAIRYYRISLKINPYYAKAHYNLGYVYFVTGDMPSARREFAITLQLDPNYNEARLYLGIIDGRRRPGP